jgi:hypothetical protein
MTEGFEGGIRNAEGGNIRQREFGHWYLGLYCRRIRQNQLHLSESVRADFNVPLR